MLGKPYGFDVVDEVADDPALEIAPVDDAAMADAVSNIASMPVVVRRKGGSVLAVSPASRVAAYREAARQGIAPREVEARILPHMDDGDARLVSSIGEWWTHRVPGDEWRDGAGRLHDALVLAAEQGKPWLRGAGLPFLACVCGSNTSTLHRIGMLQRKGAPEYRSLVDDGCFSVRTAYTGLSLPVSEQRALAADIRRKGVTEPRVASVMLKARLKGIPRSCRSIANEAEGLLECVAAGAADVPDVPTAKALHDAALALLLEATRAAGAKDAGGK